MPTSPAYIPAVFKLRKISIKEYKPKVIAQVIWPEMSIRQAGANLVIN